MCLSYDDRGRKMPTHGSLTKAGKVRNQTPKIPSTNKKKRNPKARNISNYYKRIVRGEETPRRRRR